MPRRRRFTGPPIDLGQATPGRKLAEPKQDENWVDDWGIDSESAKQAVSQLLRALGYDETEDEDLHETPRRVVQAFREQLTPEPFSLTTFPNSEGYDELVVATQIPFHSVCKHHLLGFHGVAHVGYLPLQRYVGLSKLARVVDYYSHDLQLQERLTKQIADCIEYHLQPKGVGVVLEAEHMCMSLRGVSKPGSRTVTSSLTGALREDGRARAEFLDLVKR